MDRTRINRGGLPSTEWTHDEKQGLRHTPVSEHASLRFDHSSNLSDYGQLEPQLSRGVQAGQETVPSDNARGVGLARFAHLSDAIQRYVLEDLAPAAGPIYLDGHRLVGFAETEVHRPQR